MSQYPFMAKNPQFIPGVRFDEAFFDEVIFSIGGHRLLDLYKPPPNTKHVDYLIDNFALELKVLSRDVLESPERQDKVRRLLQEELPRGPLWVTATKREVRIAGTFADKYWQRVLGAPIQDRLDKAADQIADTRTFVPGPLSGAVIIVNSVGESIDSRTFFNLANHYAERFSDIDAIFALNGVPIQLSEGMQLHFARIGKAGKADAAESLGQKLGYAISARISDVVGKACINEEVDPCTISEKLVFHFTTSGFRRKPRKT